MQYNSAFTKEWSFDGFYSAQSHMSWWGYPGPNKYFNPGPLPDTSGTCFASSRARSTAFHEVIGFWQP